MGDRAFCSAAPSLLNALPDHLRAAPSLLNALPDHLRTPQPVNVFKRGIKTYLFSKAFDLIFFFFIFLVLIFSTFGFCVNIKCYKYNLLLLLISVFLRTHTDTVMAKNIGTLAILSENCNESMSQQYVQI